MMNEKERIMVESYVFEVAKRVPKGQREDISRELNELISEMSQDDTVENVLTKLGNPAELAKKYRDDGSYLIGPGYYDNYLTVLKIVLLCSCISIVVASVLAAVFGDLSALINMFGNLITSALSAFGAVTLVFAVLERRNVKLDINNKEWSVNDLTQVTELEKKIWSNDRVLVDNRALIKRSDTVVSIVFTVIFCVMIAFAPQLLGYYVFDGQNELAKVIPIFNLDKWSVIAPVWIMSMVVGLIDDIVQFVTGFYCKLVAISKVITGVVQIGLAYVLFKVLPLWNTEFVNDLSEHLDTVFESKADILVYWNTPNMSNTFFAIVCFATLLGIATTIYKTIKYNTVTKEK